MTESLLRMLLRSRIPQLRGGYRLQRLLSAGCRSVPIRMDGDVKLYLDMHNPNGQSLELFIAPQGVHDAVEPHVRRLLKALVRKGDVAYDIGANIGLHSTLLYSLGARVIAFEPNPKVLPNLRKTIAGMPGATLIEMALSDENGKRDLFVAEDDARTSLANWSEGSALQECNVQRLDDLELIPPDLIKCDVEGAELKVFRGASKVFSNPATAPIVLFEELRLAAESFGYKQDAAQTFLASSPSGYEFFLIERDTGKLAPLPEYRPEWCDVLAVPACRKNRLEASGLRP